MDIILKQVEKEKRKKGELGLIGRTYADTIGSDSSSIFLYIFFCCIRFALCLSVVTVVLSLK